MPGTGARGAAVQRDLDRLVGHLDERGELERALVVARRQEDMEPWGVEGHRQVMCLLP